MLFRTKHCLFDASVYDKVLASFISGQMTKIDKLSCSEKFVERSMLFDIDGAVL